MLVLALTEACLLTRPALKSVQIYPTVTKAADLGGVMANGVGFSSIASPTKTSFARAYSPKISRDIVAAAKSRLSLRAFAGPQQWPIREPGLSA